MVASGKVRLQRFGIGMLAGGGGAWLAALTIGPLVALIIGIVAFLASVFVADGGAGTFFTLALLGTIGITLVLLMFVAAVLVNS